MAHQLSIFAQEDIGTVRDLSRGSENEQSKKAYESIKDKIPAMKKRIYDLAVARGPKGLTLKEACKEFKKLPHQISGRFSQLGTDKELFASDRERDGHTVWIADKFWTAA